MKAYYIEWMTDGFYEIVEIDTEAQSENILSVWASRITAENALAELLGPNTVSIQTPQEVAALIHTESGETIYNVVITK